MSHCFPFLKVFPVFLAFPSFHGFPRLITCLGTGMEPGSVALFWYDASTDENVGESWEGPFMFL